MTIKIDECKLISWKEALIALANGKEVEYLYETEWESVTGNQILITALTGDKFKFRLKPRTITINGIEVPAPFEPKKDDEFYHIWPKHECGWGLCNYSGGYEHHAQFGAWRTEEEIKQVVSALRQLFGDSHDN